MNLADKKILITGANGFVGINLLDKLKKYHKNIYALTEPGTDNEKTKNIKHKTMSVMDNAKVRDYINEIKPDIIIHLSAYRNNDVSQANIEKSTKINVGGTLNLLDAAISIKIKPFFVFISTGEVYGNLPLGSFKETDIPSPDSVYSVTKFAAEDLCEKYKNIFDLPVLIARPSVIYGPCQKESRFISSLIVALIKNKGFDMTEGMQTRDFIYVEDFIDALTGLIENGSEGIFNISSGKAVKIKSAALKIKELIKTDASVNLGKLDYRENEIWEYSPDNKKIKKEIKWRPEHTFEEGVKKTILWYKKKLQIKNK